MPPPCRRTVATGKNRCRSGKISRVDSDLGPGSDLGPVLSAVGPRLRTLRRQRDITLSALAQSTGF
jgi:hypothetical protein